MLARARPRDYCPSMTTVPAGTGRPARREWPTLAPDRRVVSPLPCARRADRGRDRRQLGTERRRGAPDQGRVRQGAVPARRSEPSAAVRARRGADRDPDRHRRAEHRSDVLHQLGRQPGDARPARPAVRASGADVAGVLHRDAHRRGAVAAGQRCRRRADDDHGDCVVGRLERGRGRRRRSSRC